MANQGIFDELVVDQWLHVEQMEERVWWMRIGETWVWATIGEDGAVKVEIGGEGYQIVKPESEGQARASGQ